MWSTAGAVEDFTENVFPRTLPRSIAIKYGSCCFAPLTKSRVHIMRSLLLLAKVKRTELE